MSSTAQVLAEAAEINAERFRIKKLSADDVRYELILARFGTVDIQLALDVAERRGSALLEGKVRNAVVTFFEGRYDVTFYDVEV